MSKSDHPSVESDKIDGVTVLRGLPVDDLVTASDDVMEGIWDALYEFRRGAGKVLVLDLGAGHLSPDSVDHIWARAQASAERMPRAARGGPIPILARTQNNLRELLTYLDTLEAPVLTAVRSDVDFDLLGFVLASSHRVCSADTVFHNRVLKTPGVPGTALPWYLMRYMGRARAQSLLLHARSYSAEEALSLGLVDAIRPADELSDYVMDLARTLASYTQDALSSMCRAFNSGELPLASYLQSVGVGFEPPKSD